MKCKKDERETNRLFRPSYSRGPKLCPKLSDSWSTPVDDIIVPQTLEVLLRLLPASTTPAVRDDWRRFIPANGVFERAQSPWVESLFIAFKRHIHRPRSLGRPAIRDRGRFSFATKLFVIRFDAKVWVSRVANVHVSRSIASEKSIKFFIRRDAGFTTRRHDDEGTYSCATRGRRRESRRRESRRRESRRRGDASERRHMRRESGRRGPYDGMVS